MISHFLDWLVERSRRVGDKMVKSFEETITYNPELEGDIIKYLEGEKDDLNEIWENPVGGESMMFRYGNSDQLWVYKNKFKINITFLNSPRPKLIKGLKKIIEKEDIN